MKTTAQTYDADLARVSAILQTEDITDPEKMKAANDNINDSWTEGLTIGEWAKRARALYPANWAFPIR